MMKTNKLSKLLSMLLLVVSVAWISPGCSAGKVPDSENSDIESAKFDPEKAKKDRSVGTATAPR